jgi:hypothetical protein
MPSRTKPSGTIYRLKLWLRKIEPPIWRRLEVPADITLPKLHRVIQIAIGWEDYHLHQFEIGRRRYEVPDPEDLMRNHFARASDPNPHRRFSRPRGSDRR